MFSSKGQFELRPHPLCIGLFRAFFADDERVGIGKIAGVPAAPVARVMEMQRIARHVLGRGDDVLAVGAKRHEFIGGDQALAHQGAGIAGLPLRVGRDDTVLGDGAGTVFGPGLVGGGADGPGEFLGALGVGAREAQDLDQFGQMQEGLAVLLAPGGIEGRDRLGEAPEVDALAGGHGVAVHDRLEVAKPRRCCTNTGSSGNRVLHL